MASLHTVEGTCVGSFVKNHDQSQMSSMALKRCIYWCIVDLAISPNVICACFHLYTSVPASSFIPHLKRLYKSDMLVQETDQWTAWIYNYLFIVENCFPVKNSTPPNRKWGIEDGSNTQTIFRTIDWNLPAQVNSAVLSQPWKVE